MRIRYVLSVSILSMLVLNASLYGVDLKPTQEQITQAVQEGKKAVGSKFMPINTFGEMGYCGWGFLQTKLWNIWAGSQFAERKFKPYTNEEIQKNLAADGMLVTYTLCTDNPRMPEVHIVLRQSQNVIQPVSMKSSHPEQTSRWPQSPSYYSTVQALFSYGAFDPRALTIITVVPPFGDRIDYEVDLSRFP